MYYNKVEICGVNTAELQLLDDDEKRELLIRAKNGDDCAREELIYGNLRLVLSVIKRFCGKKENADDLFQVGCIGLVKAVQRFNLDIDVKFSTYAVPMILGELRRYLRDNTCVRISRSIRDLAYKALKASEEIQNEKEREATVEEIALRIDAPRDQVYQAMEAIVEPMSIYEPVCTDNGDSLYVIDKLSDGCSDDGWLESIALKEAIKSLTERERTIIGMRYYSNRTQNEIASEIGISQAQVSRLEKGALEKMRKLMV
jgi:RNA polymerase sporulation-specific sigma factor